MSNGRLYLWTSLIVQLVKNLPSMCKTLVGFMGWENRDRLPAPVFLGFPSGSAGKESACNMGDLASILGLGRFPWSKGKTTHSSILAWRFPLTV